MNPKDPLIELQKCNILDGIEAVIFDLDGTLVDSMWLWHEIDIEYFGRFGIKLPDEFQQSIEGMSIYETAVYVKERFQIPDPLEKIMDDWNQMAWDKYENEVPLKKGAEKFIRKCLENGILLGIATSNSRKLVENVLRVHDLLESFSSIMTGSEVKNGKPAPDIYLAVAKELNIAPPRCLVFEDIVPGIMAGKNAGMKVCAVEDTYSRDVRDEKEKTADCFIEDYDEINK